MYSLASHPSAPPAESPVAIADAGDPDGDPSDPVAVASAPGFTPDEKIATALQAFDASLAHPDAFKKACTVLRSFSAQPGGRKQVAAAGAIPRVVRVLGVSTNLDVLEVRT